MSTSDHPRHALLAGLAALTCVAAPSGCRGAPRAEPAMLLVAAGLRHAMPDLLAAFAEGRPAGTELLVSYGASGSLRAAVEAGAPADAVLFASPDHVERLVSRGLADASSVRALARNPLVLAGGRDAEPLTFATLDRLPAERRLAIGNPETAPVGRYARDALQALGVWQGLQGRLVLGGSVAAAMTYARRGEVAAAIVFATEAAAFDDVRVLDRADGPWAPEPVFVGATLPAGNHADVARAFLDFLCAPRGQAILREHGFLPVGARSTSDAGQAP